MPVKAARLPPPVESGDLVGVAALSSRPESSALEAGLEQLRGLGFRTRLAGNLEADWHGFAGDDATRLEGFHELVSDSEVRAIFFARGGHGVLRLLPRIDWALLQANHKAFVGYSDLTPFLLQVVERLDLVCFHGPMIATDLSATLAPEERASLLGALAGDLSGSLGCFASDDDAQSEGVLLGGCLSLLTATLGTDYFPDLTGSLLFLEDVNEPLYRIDRMLTQLRLSGTLDQLKGMILGYLEPTDVSWNATTIGSLPDLLGRPRKWPLAWGLASGHGRPNLTLPLGVAARLCPREGHLELLSAKDSVSS